MASEAKKSPSAKNLDKFLRKHLRMYAALRLSSRGDWGRATVELLITLVFGLLPIWVPLIVYPMFGLHAGTVQEIIYEQIKHGELYFLASALLAPIFYFTFPAAQNPSRAQRSFPSHQTLIFIFFFYVILSVLAVAASKLQAETTGIPPRMVRLSVWLFGFSCVFFYFTLTVKNWFERGGVEELFDEQSRTEEKIAPDPEKEAEPAAPEPDDLVAQTLADHVVPGSEGEAQ
jgi:hypothetical protein